MEREIENTICELGEYDEKTEALNCYIRKTLASKFCIYTNKYLEKFIIDKLNLLLEVKGRQPKLFTCYCCGYKTFDKRSEYSICQVCFWKDDGMTDLMKVSGPNHMTLGEAIANFHRCGAIDEGALLFLHPDR